MATHKNLEIWNTGINLVIEVYSVTKEFPKEEKYGLASQMRRAAVSIPSNIAEGAARKSDTEFIQFLYIALGSLNELETQTIIAHRLGYIIEDHIISSMNSLGRSINSFLKYIKSLQIKKN